MNEKCKKGTESVRIDEARDPLEKAQLLRSLRLSLELPVGLLLKELEVVERVQLRLERASAGEYPWAHVYGMEASEV